MTTLRDALSSAFDKAETGTLEAPQEVAIETPEASAPVESGETAQQREDRLRDERGRFAKAETTEATAPTATQPAGTDPALVQPDLPQPVTPPVETRKPPSSWSKDQWERWNKLDPETQAYIEKREADFAKGVSTYKGQWDQAQPIYEAVQPFMPELQQYGLTPTQWIQNLGTAHRTLALGTPEQKLQMFAKLATDYGVPLQGLTGGQVDPQFTHVAQMVGTLQSRLQQMEMAREMQEEARTMQEIEAFKTNAPHFDAVRETMGQLLQSGVATDLQNAYDKAIRLHDGIWQQEQEEERARQAAQSREAAAKAEAQRQAEIAKKKAAAVSPRSSSPTGNTTAGAGKKDRKALLAEAFDENASGHF